MMSLGVGFGRGRNRMKGEFEEVMLEGIRITSWIVQRA